MASCIEVINADVGVAVGVPIDEAGAAFPSCQEAAPGLQQQHHKHKHEITTDPPMADSCLMSPSQEKHGSVSDIIRASRRQENQTSAEKQNRLYCCTLWILIFSLIIATMASVLVVGYAFDLLSPGKDQLATGRRKSSLDETYNATTPTVVYDREAYYKQLVDFLGSVVLAPGSVQSRAMQWMAFEDVPIVDGMMDYDRFWQRFALVVWYFEQGGPNLWSAINWDASSGWTRHGAGVHECDWKGVDCNKYLKVTGLRLGRGMGIIQTGTSLSTEIGALTHLTFLDFSTHRLKGSIPEEWRALTNLESLILSGNLLGYTIPEWIGDLSKLKLLALDGNVFTGTVPASLGSLSTLERLELQRNFQLNRTLSELVEPLTELEYIDISMTRIGGTLPETNATLPSYFGQYIENFQATHVPLTGTIPTTISLWSNLEKLTFEELPGITGTVPTELGLLVELRFLKISYVDKLKGTIPTEFGLLSDCLSLDLSWSGREGKLPTDLGRLRDLVTLELQHNHDITGIVPDEYSEMSSLRHLYLHGTSLSGAASENSDICGLNLENFITDCHHMNQELICDCCTSCQLNP